MTNLVANSNPVVVGLIKGRHEMPVDMYIFNESIEDVHNYSALNSNIAKFIEDEIGVCRGIGLGLNQMDYTDVEIYRGERPLVVYVTGLTAVTAELIKVCALNGIALTLMNFDTVSGEYKEQVIF